MVLLDKRIETYPMRMNNKSNNIKWYIIGGVSLVAVIIIIAISSKGKKAHAVPFSYTFNDLKWEGEPNYYAPNPKSDTPPDSLPVSIEGDWLLKGIAALSIRPDIELTNPPTDSIVKDDFANNLSEQLADKAHNIKSITGRAIGDGSIIPMIAKVYDGYENELPLFDRSPANSQDLGTRTIDEFYLIKKSSVQNTVNGVVIDSEDIWHFDKRWIRSLQFLFNVTALPSDKSDGSSRGHAERVPLGTEIHKVVFELQNSDIKIPYIFDTPIIIKKKEEEEDNF